MPESFLSHLFEPFTRNRNTQRVEGSGLGLSITKGLIELMGGKLYVESREREGTAFRVELEYKIALEDNKGKTAKTMVSPAISGKTGLQTAVCWWQKIMRLMRKYLASCYCCRA